MVDMFGQELEVGDHVVYPIGVGKVAKVNVIGEVTEVTPHTATAKILRNPSEIRLSGYMRRDRDTFVMRNPATIYVLNRGMT